MSIELEINRIKADVTKVRNKTVEFGLSLPDDNFDKVSTAVAGIKNNTAVQAKIKEGETFTIPKGYHNGSGVVQGVAGGGNYELQTKIVTPTKEQQSITSDVGYYGLGGVTVNAIPANYNDTTEVTATDKDVLVNKVIVTSTGQSVAGTMPNNGDTSKTMDGLTSTSVSIPAGYTTGGTVSLTNEIENRLKEI